MKLLLHSDVPKLGYFGDVVEVSQGYARNYLLPQKLAVVPTEENVKAIEQDRARKAEERRLVREQLLVVAGKVEGAEVTIEALANETGHLFGSISESDIASSLQEKGFEIQKKQVVLAEHIRMVGDTQIKLRFAEDVTATIELHVVRPEDPASDESATESADDADRAE